jgi:acetamidase/formamidase
MIGYLVDVHGLERHETHMLSSAAADLKIAAVVNGTMLVSTYIPKSLFRARR